MSGEGCGCGRVRGTSRGTGQGNLGLQRGERGWGKLMLTGFVSVSHDSTTSQLLKYYIQKHFLLVLFLYGIKNWLYDGESDYVEFLEHFLRFGLGFNISVNISRPR